MARRSGSAARERRGVGEDLHAPVLGVEGLADDPDGDLSCRGRSATTVSPTWVWVAVRNGVATTISPGPAEPAAGDHPVAVRRVVAGEGDASRPASVSPATVTSVCGDAAVAAGAGLGGDRRDDGGRVGRRRRPAAPVARSARRRAAVRLRRPGMDDRRRRGSPCAWTWFSEAPSPTANVAAAAPNAIAATIVADRERPGRTGGPGRGSPAGAAAAVRSAGPPTGRGPGRGCARRRARRRCAAGRPGPPPPRRSPPPAPAPRRAPPASTHGVTPGVGRCRRPGWSRPAPGRSAGCRRRRRAPAPTAAGISAWTV